MFCNKCGAKIVENSVYCHKCGNRVDILLDHSKQNDVMIKSENKAIESRRGVNADSQKNNRKTGWKVKGVIVFILLAILMIPITMLLLHQTDIFSNKTVWNDVEECHEVLNWDESYLRFIESKKYEKYVKAENENGRLPNSRMIAIHDFDNDRIPELIIRNRYDGTDEYYFFQHKNGGISILFTDGVVGKDYECISVTSKNSEPKFANDNVHFGVFVNDYDYVDYIYKKDYHELLKKGNGITGKIVIYKHDQSSDEDKDDLIKAYEYAEEIKFIDIDTPEAMGWEIE